MPDTDLPTLQQRVERVLDRKYAHKPQFASWDADDIALALVTMNSAFEHEDEAEIAGYVSDWLRKVNHQEEVPS